MLLYYVVEATQGWGSIAELVFDGRLLSMLAALAFAGLLIEAFRLTIVCRGEETRLPVSQSIRLVLLGTFFNYIVPGGTGGDAAKLYYLTVGNRGKGVEMATVLVADRTIAFVSLLLMILVLAAVNAPVVASTVLLRWVVSIVFLAVVAISTLTWLLLRSHALPQTLPRVVAGVFRNRWVRRAVGAVHRIGSRRVVLWGAVAVSLCGHSMVALMFLVSGAAVFGAPPTAIVPLLGFVALLANAVPITPGGIGVGEGAFEVLFRLVGFSGGSRLIILWRVATLPLAVVGGILYATGYGRIALADNASLQSESHGT
ncbi:MAG: UPF0104 family protein [Candidatus Dadabacteria bacterium]|nr:MAG: UPF0104 family protein [Candidatus Dadabacteria bacterium]